MISEFIQGIIKPIWEVLVFVPMPWRAIVVVLVLMPICSWFFWRIFPWLLVKFLQLISVGSELLANMLLFGEYLLTKNLRKKGHQPPEYVYIFADFLRNIVSFLYLCSQELDKVRQKALKKRWLPRRIWLIITGIIILLTWYARPVFGETTVGKFIDNSVIFWYSFDNWLMNPQSKLSTLNSYSPTEFVKAYYSTINKRQYIASWNCLSLKFQTKKSSLPSGFISYVSWWEQQVERIEITQQPSVEKQNNNSAIVKVQLQYLLKNQQKLSEPESVRLWLVRDGKTKRWMINHSRVI